MRKVAFVQRVAGRSQVAESVVRAVLDGLRVELVDALGHGEVVALDGFGRFRLARQVRAVPCELTGSTGDRTYVSFRAARVLKEDLAAARKATEAEVRRLRNALDRLGALAPTRPRPRRTESAEPDPG